MLILLFTLSIYADEDYRFLYKGETSETREYTLLGVDQIRHSSCRRFYSEAAGYLCFLPGPIACAVFVFLKKRKTALLLMVFAALAFLAADDPFPSGLINQGIDAFKSGQYEKALERFESAEAVLGCNSALSYNIALCHYVKGENGRAMFNLRQSIQAEPRQTLAREVLRWIEEDSGLATQVRPGIKLHPNLPYVLLLFLFNLFFITLGVLYRRRLGRLFILSVFLALLVLTSLALFLYSLSERNSPTAVVVVDRGELKKVPLANAQTWIALKEGSSLRVKGRARDYVLVKTGQGLVGWVEANTIEITR